MPPDTGSKPVFISAQATQAVLGWDEMIAGLRAAYSVPHKPQTSSRAVARGDRVWLRALASAPPGSRYMGTKVFGMSRANQVTHLVALFDEETAELVALIDAYHITALRTGATSAVAIDRLAPRRSPVIGVLGSGTEAHSHLRAALEKSGINPTADPNRAFFVGRHSD